MEEFSYIRHMLETISWPEYVPVGRSLCKAYFAEVNIGSERERLWKNTT